MTVARWIFDFIIRRRIVRRRSVSGRRVRHARYGLRLTSWARRPVRRGAARDRRRSCRSGAPVRPGPPPGAAPTPRRVEGAGRRGSAASTRRRSRARPSGSDADDRGHHRSTTAPGRARRGHAVAPPASARYSTGAARRSAADSRTLRLESASPSASRTVGQPDDLDRERQVGRQRADHRQLLEVLLTEVGAAAPGHGEELGHHRGTPRRSGPGRARPPSTVAQPR